MLTEATSFCFESRDFCSSVAAGLKAGSSTEAGADRTPARFHHSISSAPLRVLIEEFSYEFGY